MDGELFGEFVFFNFACVVYEHGAYGVVCGFVEQGLEFVVFLFVVNKWELVQVEDFEFCACEHVRCAIVMFQVREVCRGVFFKVRDKILLVLIFFEDFFLIMCLGEFGQFFDLML